MQVSSRFITLHDSRMRKCHLGTLLLRPFTFFISQGKCCACKSWARWTEFHFSQGKLLSTTRNHPLRRVYCAIVLYPIYHLVSPAHLHYRDRQEMSEHSEVCVCLCVCGKTEQGGSWGIQSLTQRSRDRWADTLQAQNNPDGIHEWNDRITGVLENLLRWLIMPFMVGRHTACREKVKLFD